jgi:hypothetical protein
MKMLERLEEQAGVLVVAAIAAALGQRPLDRFFHCSEEY